METEIKIEDILKQMREVIGTMAQEIAVLKAQIEKLSTPPSE
jgi:hypothetical protein